MQSKQATSTKTLLRALTNRWFVAFCVAAILVAIAWPRYDFRARVPSPDGSHALMVYVDGSTFPLFAPGDWVYKPAYAYLVDDKGNPVGSRFFRNCHFQLGDIFNGAEYSAHWAESIVEIAKFSRINRTTGRAGCQN